MIVFHLISDLVCIVDFDNDRLDLNISLVQVPLRFHLEAEAKLLYMKNNLGLYSCHCEDYILDLAAAESEHSNLRYEV